MVTLFRYVYFLNLFGDQDPIQIIFKYRNMFSGIPEAYAWLNNE